MGLSVVKRPIGFIKSTVSAIGTYANGSSAITKSSHGLTTGVYIYISTGQAIEFWYVTVLGVNTFTVSEYATAPAYVFVGTGSLTYYTTLLTHGYNAVHLPIIYKLKSDVWPVNSVDTISTVSSFANDNGFTKLTLSGAITTSVSELEFVQLFGPQAGVYQIMTWYSNSVVTINLSYNSGYTFGTVQYYYRNYHARIRIYAGLEADHFFVDQKPFELLSEQQVTPDENGIVFLNINDYLKTKINSLTNNLNLPTIPNNLDGFCEFYITYAEGYDYSSGGYGLLDYISGYVDDSAFIGKATNSDLPFKNQYSGIMSEYLSAIPVKAKFLTPSLYPQLSVGNFFELHFLNQFGKSLQLRIELYLNGAIPSVVYDTIEDYGIGIYRKQISQTASEDRIDVTLVLASQSLSALSLWTQWSTGVSWSATPSVTITDVAGVQSKYISIPFIGIAGITYTFNYNITLSGKSGSASTMDIFAFLSSGQALPNYGIDNDQYSTDGVKSGTLVITPTVNTSYLNIYAFMGILGTPASWAIQINSISVNAQSPVDISETKTIQVDFSCYSNSINLSWLNFLGGFDYWTFKGFADFGIDVKSEKRSTKNFIPQFPKSYGSDADTLSQVISKRSKGTILLRAENLTKDQVDDLYRIMASPLVQIVNSAIDRKTVILNANSFIYHPQANRLFEISFTIELTENLPGQTL